MNYSLLLVKKSIKNRLLLVPVLIVIVAIFGMLFLNFDTLKTSGLVPLLNSEIKSQQENIQDVQGDENSSELVNVLNERIELERQAIDYIGKDQWAMAYPILIDLQQSLLDSLPIESQEDAIGVRSELLRRQYYQEKNMAYESDTFPIKGITFTFSVLQTVVPFFFTVCLIFYLAELFCSGFKNKLNKTLLLPQSIYKTGMQTMLISFSMVVTFLVAVLLVTFGVASILFGTSSFSAPIIAYFSQGNPELSSVGQLFLPSFVLLLLSIAFIVCFLYLLALVFKDRLVTMFVGIFVIYGLFLASFFLVPIQMITYYLPTTYINSFNILNGAYANQIKNYHFSFPQSLTVLVSSIFIVLLGIVFLLNRERTLPVKKKA